jgi:hypothetical protein
MIEDERGYTVGLFMDDKMNGLRFGILQREEPKGSFIMIDTMGGVERTVKNRFIVTGSLYDFF